MGSPAEGDSQVASLWAARLTGFFSGRGASWRAEDIEVAEWLDRPAESLLVRAYEALLRVPAGTVVSYGELAALSGRPRAARAVGTAMARNPFPILVPCHRVVRSSGDIGEYGGGRAWKERLLRFEGAAP
jgi:O-6-methylguanine DNA methyltransferase